MKYYVTTADDGELTGFYSDENNGDNIPEGALPITEEQWRQYVDNYRKFRRDGNIIREKTQAELDEEAANQSPGLPSIEERLTQTELILNMMMMG